MERPDDSGGSTRTDNVRIAQSDVSIIFLLSAFSGDVPASLIFDYRAEFTEAKFDIEDVSVKLIKSSLANYRYDNVELIGMPS